MSVCYFNIKKLMLFFYATMFFILASFENANAKTGSSLILEPEPAPHFEKYCEVFFDTRRSFFNKEELDKCIKQSVDKIGILEINYTVTISNVKCEILNNYLALDRSDAIQNYILEKFPGASVNNRSSLVKHYRYAPIGVIIFGSASNEEVRKITKDIALSNFNKSIEEECDSPPPEKIASQVPAEEKSYQDKTPYRYKFKREEEPIIHTVRLAFRGASDTYLHNKQNYIAEYQSLGGEIGLGFQPVKYFRFEVGFLGGVLTNNSAPTIYTYYNALGVYFIKKLLVLGGRVLLGGVQDQNNNVDLDVGIEGKVGMEYETISILLDAGFTKNTNRVGVEVGFIF